MSRLAPEKSTTKVLLVDDHPIVRHGLGQLIGQEEDFEICAAVSDAVDALAKIKKQRPDVVVLDIGLKGMDGLELLKIIHSKFPKILVLMLSMHDEALYAERALRLGARGYVMKQEAPEVVVSAIRKIKSGQIYLNPIVSEKIIGRLADGRETGPSDPIERLSNRELQVFRMVGQGISSRKIAAELCVSIKTVESYREHIKSKLNLRDASELLQYAMHWLKTENV